MGGISMKKILTALILGLIITVSAATAFAANSIALDSAKDQKSGQTEVNCCVDVDQHDDHHK